MIRLITYSDSNMTLSAEKCVQSAIKYAGVTEAVRYGPDHISHDFKEINKDIFQEGARGAGCYWLFKPYIIYKEMLTMQDGDFLVYSDAGIQFIDNLTHITSRMKNDFFFFSNGWKHVEWCKLNVFKSICPDHRYGVHIDRPTQIQASLIFIRVNQKTKDFIKEWLLWSQMPGFIDDSVSEMPNYSTFADHRHDQAILTCCVIKHDIPYENLWPDHLWVNQRHRWPHSDYPPILIHHRKRNNEY